MSKDKKKKKKGPGKVKAVIWGIISACFLTLCVVGCYVLFYMISYINGDLVINLEEYKENQNQTSFIYATDKNGKTVEIARLHGVEDRVWVDLENISPYMSKAFVALEDRRFNSHHGVDWIRVGGVIIKPQNIGQGGSTITQQLIKNITNNKEVTVVRKVREMLMALNLEKHYSKDTIIEAYFNTLYLGSGCNGVKTASAKYFGKDVKDLNAAECAALASITQSPTKYNPLLNPENNRTRQLYCLKMMYEDGLIGSDEYKEAKDFHMIFTNSDDYVPNETSEEINKIIYEDDKINSFYVDAVIDAFINQMMDEFGYTKQQATSKLYYGGYKIYAAVDLEVQKVLEDVYVNRTTFPNIKKKDGTKPQSSMTIMDYNGRVVAIVGQAGEKTKNRVFNRATSSWRQPGSTIKPLATYAPAFELGLINYATRVKDQAIWVKGKQWPRNVDKSYGSGLDVSIEYAIKKSLNTVPARLVNDVIGIDNSYDFLRDRFHLSRLDEINDRQLSPLATGALTNGTNTLEMAAAYATFGNGGVYYKPYFYTKVTNAQGTQIIFNNEKNPGQQVISSETSDIICELLQKVDTSYYAKAPNARKFQIIAKTGTTSSDCDRWFCAGTPHYVAAVWFGYDIKEPLNQTINPCGKIFFAVFDRIHKKMGDKKFPKSEGTTQKRYCTVSGKLAGDLCYSTNMGWFKLDDLPMKCSTCTGEPPTTAVNPSSSSDLDVSQIVGDLLESIIGER